MFFIIGIHGASANKFLTFVGLLMSEKFSKNIELRSDFYSTLQIFRFFVY